MRRLLFLLFLIPFFATSALAQQRCFKAFIGNREVSVICVNTPVRFVHCSGIVSAELVDQDNNNNLGDSFVPNSPNTTYTYSTPGTYKVTMLKTLPPPQDSSTVSQFFIVKATPKPHFTATQCGPNQVRVTIKDTNYDSLYLFLNNGSRQVVTSNQQLTLPTSGNPYTLKLTGKYGGGNCGADSIISITPPAPPALVKITRLQVRAGGNITFRFSGLQAGYRYRLEEQNGSVFTSKTVFASSAAPGDSLVLGGINTNIPACFRVVALDNCDFEQGTPSPVICSTVIQAVAQNNQNELTWPAYTGQTPAGSGFAYAVFRRENNTGPRTEITPAGFQGLTFTDNQVTCATNYCYELEITDANGGFSVSNKTCVTAISTDIPAGANLLTSFGTDNIMQGTVTLPANTSLKTLQVQKNSKGLNFANFTSTVTPNFKDPDKNFKTIKPCYQVTYTNNCNNSSPESNVSCPVILTSEVDKIKRTVKLEWSEYVGFGTAGLEYTLELLDENFSVKSSEVITGAFTKEEKLSDTDQILRYRVKVTAGGQISYSNLETIIQEVKIFVPNAFSPNGDGLNDVFEVKGRFQNNFTLLILNRWGEIIFESRDPKKGWDGMVNEVPAPVGIYAYRLDARDEQGKKYQTTGTLTLLR